MTDMSRSAPATRTSVPSLSIGTGDDGRLLLKCSAGCSWDELRAALGLESSIDSSNGNGSAPIEVARYVYRDERGRELYQKVRFAPKRFVRAPKGATSSLYGLERIPSTSRDPCSTSPNRRRTPTMSCTSTPRRSPSPPVARRLGARSGRTESRARGRGALRFSSMPTEPGESFLRAWRRRFRGAGSR